MPSGPAAWPADPLGVRGACATVVERAHDVSLGPLERILDAIAERPVPAWDGRRHYSGPVERVRAYLLVLDAANFSFWGGPGGYWRLAEGLRDAFRAGDDLADPARLASVDAAGLAHWIGELPMMEERAASLRDLGRLAGELGGFEALVATEASATAALLAARLPSFADTWDYDGLRVPLLKRAQIAAADLAGAGVADFPDLDTLTVFADYKLPQVLRHFGALAYSESLARRVDDWVELAPGEPAEVEIRAATVVAGELIRDALAERGRRLRAHQVDWLLWDLSQGLYPVRPHHRVRTTAY